MYLLNKFSLNADKQENNSWKKWKLLLRYDFYIANIVAVVVRMH